MYLSEHLLGANIVRQLRDRAATPILTIGKDKVYRSTLGKIECWNFAAAANLSKILNAELNAKSIKDVFDNIPPSALALPRLGSISLAVLGAAFESEGLGGEAPLDAWAKKHRTSPQDTMVTFHTIKMREAEGAKQERRARKERKQQRRDQAHRLRTARFEKKES